MFCRSIYWPDGITYEGVVLSIDKLLAFIHFGGANNVASMPFHKLFESHGDESCRRQLFDLNTLNLVKSKLWKIIDECRAFYLGDLQYQEGNNEEMSDNLHQFKYVTFCFHGLGITQFVFAKNLLLCEGFEVCRKKNYASH